MRQKKLCNHRPTWKKGRCPCYKKPFLGLVPMKTKERSVWIESVVYAEIVFTSLVWFSYSIKLSFTEKPERERERSLFYISEKIWTGWQLKAGQNLPSQRKKVGFLSLIIDVVGKIVKEVTVLQRFPLPASLVFMPPIEMRRENVM